MAEGRRERVKTKVREVGLLALAPHEMLEFLLYPFVPRKDTAPIARALLAAFGSLSLVFHASEEALLNVVGMTKGAALYFSQFHNMMSYIKSGEMREGKPLQSILDAKAFLCDCIGFLPTEELHALFLDTKNRLIQTKKISSYSLPGSADFFVRALVEDALKYHAAFVILGHNHPSGELAPSKTDLAETQRAKYVLQGIGVQLVDHIIVSKKQSISFREQGLL